METSTIHPHNAQPDSLQTTLQTARKSKRLSQLELALRMGVSQRHVSFVESGRAQPSRELLLSWLHELQAPLALRNVALQQAGFAPVYRGSELADAVLAPVRDALAQLLQAHDPMPAMVMDAAWNVLHMNRGAQWLATTLMPWLADLPPGAPVNMIDAMLHPEGMTKHITNLEEVAPALLAHMRDDASVVPDILPRVEQLAQHRAVPASLAEGLENRQVMRVVHDLELGVPLHGQGKALAVLDRNRFHQAIRCQRFHPQPGGQYVDALAVDGIDVEYCRQAHTVEHAARLYMQGVARPILLVEGLILAFAVVHEHAGLVDLLVQGATQRHVHFLEATANAEYRYTGGDGGAHQRQRGGIAQRVVMGARSTGRAVVVVRLDVGRRTGEDQPIHHVKNIGAVHQLT